MTPSTLFPVSYNLTYVCPSGQVFDHDWFATPVILLTCQVRTICSITQYDMFVTFQESGAFDDVDWTLYQCVRRKLEVGKN